MGKNNEFKEHIFGCHRDPTICWIGLCVPCGYQFIQAKAATEAYEGDISFICFLSMTFCLGCFGGYCVRRNTIKRFGILEDKSKTLCSHCWCAPCAACQEYREVQSRKTESKTQHKKTKSKHHHHHRKAEANAQPKTKSNDELQELQKIAADAVARIQKY